MNYSPCVTKKCGVGDDGYRERKSWHLTYSTTTTTIPESEQLNVHHARYAIGVTQLVTEALFM